MTTALDRTMDALQRAISEHGFPNGFSAGWLSDIEGGVSRAEACRAGRAHFKHGATLRVGDEVCYVVYEKGHFDVDDPTKCGCFQTRCQCGSTRRKEHWL